MEGFFSSYRANKEVDRTGINLLLKTIRKRTKKSAYIVLSGFNSQGEHINENWRVSKNKTGKFNYELLDVVTQFEKMSVTFKTTALNYLTTSSSIIVLLICDMNQKIDKKKGIKEIWGFKIANENKSTIFEQISSDDIYKFSTTNLYTGKSIPPQKEVVYCGPDGKICGWDML